MAKKLICLLLLIPIIVMISLFAVTKSVSIMVDVQVSGIRISDADEHIYLNKDRNETHSIDYTVYPINAKNKGVTVYTEPVLGKDKAEFDFEYTDGTINVKPTKAGSAKIYVSTDVGGFKQSLTVHVDSSEVSGISGSVLKNGVSVNELMVNDTASIYTVFTPKVPADANSKLTYTSSNPAVVKAYPNGQIKALTSGSAEITVTYGEFTYTLSLEVKIAKDENDDGTKKYITLAGENEIFEDYGTLSVGTVNIPDFDKQKLTLKAYLASDTERLSPIAITYDVNVNAENNEISISYTFNSELAEGTAVILLAEYEDVTAEFDITKKLGLDISFIDNGISVTEKYIDFPSVRPEDKIQIGLNVNPLTPEEVKKANYSVSSDNTAVISNLTVINGNLMFNALKPGVATISVSASYKGAVSEVTSITVYVSPGSSFSIKDPAISLDVQKDPAADFDPHSFDRSSIEDIITVGRWEYNANGELVHTEDVFDHQIKLNYLFANYNQNTIDPSFEENLTWSVVRYDKNGNEIPVTEVYVHDGVLCFNDQYGTFNDIVELRLTFGSKTNASNTVSAVYKMRCISNAINVYSYLELLGATTMNSTMDVVLRKHISRDFGYYYDGDELKAYYTTMHTTYDDQYYKNVYGDGTDAYNKKTEIKVLMEFRSGVYGNGHTINAHNLSYGWDTVENTLSKDALFRGPLNFVAVSNNTEGSGDAISVKGQDNICFAVYGGVTLNNVHLQGSSLEPDENNLVNLNLLTYSGTVVEILGDSANIEYSRITNGRTVIRAFGERYVEGKVTPATTLNIKNSVLSGAREFIIRTGSNRVIEGSYETPAPAITPENTDGYGEGAIVDSDNAHNAKSYYNGIGAGGYTAANREYYDNNYINTFVNIENTVIRDAGLFAIGIDSHFASSALANGNQFVYRNDDPLLQSALSHFKLDKAKETSLIDNWKNLAKTSYGAKVKFIGEVGLYTWKPLDDINSDSLIEVPVLTNESAEGATGFAKLVTALKFDIKTMIRDSISQKYPIVDNINGTDYVHCGIAFFGGGKNYGVFDMTEATRSDGTQYNIAGYSVGFGDLLDQAMLHYAAGSEPFFFYMFNSTADSFRYKDQLTVKDGDVINKNK